MKRILKVCQPAWLLVISLAGCISVYSQSSTYFLQDHMAAKNPLIFYQDDTISRFPTPFAYNTKAGIIVSDDEYLKRIYNLGDGTELKWWKYSITNGQKFPFDIPYEQYRPYKYKLLVDQDTVLTINQVIYGDIATQQYTGYIDINKKSLDGDSISHESYRDFDDGFPKVNYVMEDAIVFGEHYVVSGLCVHAKYPNDYLGFLLWMKKDGSRDTTMILREDMYNKSRRMQLTPEGHLAVLSEHSYEGENGKRSFYQKVTQYNTKKEKIWEVKTHHYQRSNDLNAIDMVFLRNGNVVIKSFDSIDVFVPVLTCYAASGEVVWQYTFERGQKSKNFNRMIQLIDGNIVCAGYYHDYTSAQRIFLASYLCKINATTGELLWERIFPWLFQRATPPQLIASNYLLDVIELDNGDLFAPVYGGRFSFLKTDKDGCITPGCGLYQEWNKPR